MHALPTYLVVRSELTICSAATMAFSSFTLGEGVCSSSERGVLLPTCPLLTFDLALLHLLSTATLALLLVILSNTLSPSYYATLSLTDSGSGKDLQGDAGPSSMLVMWELAVGSPPPSPRLQPSSSAAPTGYGAIDSMPAPAVETPSSSSAPPTVKRDRFAEGRVISYALLLLVSLGVIVCAVVLMNMGEFGEPNLA